MSDDLTTDIEERDIPQKEREDAPASDFAGKDRSFPILKPEDVSAAAASIGRAGPDNYDTATLKENIIRIAKRKGEAFVAKLPQAWKESAADSELDSELMPLVERAVANDNTIDLKLIAPGWGSSGYYSEDLLKRDGPKAWLPGTHMYLDHPTESEARERPERSVRDLAGVIVSTPEYREDGSAGPGLYAKASVLPPYKEVIDALAPHIGVSIRASGHFAPGEAEGREGKIIDSIRQGHSVDFVTKPGAGGKVLALMESLRQKSDSDVLSTNPEETNDDQAAVTEAAEEAESMELQEAQERITALEAEIAETRKQCDDAEERAERAEGAIAVLEAKREVGRLLANIELPDAAKDRVTTKITVNPPLTEGKLDTDKLAEAVEAAAKEEAEYLEAVTGAGKVTDQGTQSGGPAADETKIKESLASGMGRFFNLSDEAAKVAADRR